MRIIIYTVIRCPTAKNIVTYRYRIIPNRYIFVSTALKLATQAYCTTFSEMAKITTYPLGK